MFVPFSRGRFFLFSFFSRRYRQQQQHQKKVRKKSTPSRGERAKKKETLFREPLFLTVFSSLFSKTFFSRSPPPPRARSWARASTFRNGGSHDHGLDGRRRDGEVRDPAQWGQERARRLCGKKQKTEKNLHRKKNWTMRLEVAPGTVPLPPPRGHASLDSTSLVHFMLEFGHGDRN